MLKSIQAKNIDLLLKSNKNLGILKGVYNSNHENKKRE